MKILAIESSCDETACAIVGNGTKEIASEVASSADMHHITGGIVPEVAARKQVEYIVPVVDSTLHKASESLGINIKDIKEHIDAIAVTVGPGLAGSLIVGIEAAKSLALAWGRPIIAVNHLIGHIYANFLETDKETPGIRFPAAALVVSGGHTDIVLMKDHGNLEYLGGTIDDAAGEAFDKVARLLGLGMYLGGANLSRTASEYTGVELPEKLPRSLLHQNNYDFSFSGLKTAVKRLADKNMYPVPAIAKEFEESVVEVLTEKTLKAVENTKAKSVLLGGGVSANRKLRNDLINKVGEKFPDVVVHIPPFRLCTDNAVSIASAAYFNQNYKTFDNITPNPSMTIKD